MAFKATNILPEHGYRIARTVALQLRNDIVSAIEKFNAGPNAYDIYKVISALRSAELKLNSVKMIPGIAAYAKLQEDDINYNVAAEFIAMLNVINTAATTIYNAVPVCSDAGGYVAMTTLGTDGKESPRSFSAASVASLIPQLEAVRDTIV